tara:strand:+ start:319 stop:573 length:255 start_codon:yes stop_codon:yes gene_type:complete
MGKIVIIVLCGIYILSPIDFLPEILLGPLGFLDDFIAGLFATTVALVWKEKKGNVPPVLKEPANWEMGQNCPPILKSEPPILLN